jgi:hypothetical protein
LWEFCRPGRACSVEVIILMEFDERLHRAFETLTERLHQEIAAQLNAARADLAGAVEADRDAAAAIAARDARAAAEQEMSERLAESVARAGTDTRSQVIADHKAARERLVEGVRAIDAALSLSDVLDALVAAASAESGRAAVFVPQRAMLRAWRLAGFDALSAGSSVVELPFTDAGLIAEAVETAQLVRADPGASRATLLPSFVELPDQARALAVPLVMAGQVFAVLYADEGGTEPGVDESWPATIEVLALHAARVLEAITATRLGQVAEVAEVASR